MALALFTRITPAYYPVTLFMKRGSFIVVEGLDRSGKSTQTAKLVESFTKAGKSVKLYKFPGGKCVSFFIVYAADLN